MTTMFSCGTGGFAQMDHDDGERRSPPSTPRKSSSKKQNPYSSRGLDKFSMVLAELETRREKIVKRTGSQGVAMVRFMYNNSQDWIPIVVRPKDPAVKQALQEEETPAPAPAVVAEAKKGEAKEKVVAKMRRWLDWERMRWRESCYWPLAALLILLCVVMFGRVFAICCVSVWWYVAPMMKEQRAAVAAGPKKEMGRRLSDKRLGGHVKKVR